MPKLIKMTFCDENEIQSLLNEIKSIDLAEFFEILSFQNPVDILNTEYVTKINDIKSKYGKLLSTKTNSSQILIEFEKIFSKIDTEFDKLIKFCKVYYNSQDQHTKRL